jgi:hypothetical protein
VFHNAYGPDKPWFYEITQSGGGCLMDLGTHVIDLGLRCGELLLEPAGRRGAVIDCRWYGTTGGVRFSNCRG